MFENEVTINGEKCYLHHTAYARGYVSRKLTRFADYPKEAYCGRYGEGYKVLTPCYHSTSYCVVAYYIKK